MKRFQEKIAPSLIKNEALNLHDLSWRETERIPMDLHKSIHRIRTNKNIKRTLGRTRPSTVCVAPWERPGSGSVVSVSARQTSSLGLRSRSLGS